MPEDVTVNDLVAFVVEATALVFLGIWGFAVLGSGVLAAAVLLPAPWAIGFAALTVVNTVLLYVGPFAR